MKITGRKPHRSEVETRIKILETDARAQELRGHLDSAKFLRNKILRLKKLREEL